MKFVARSFDVLAVIVLGWTLSTSPALDLGARFGFARAKTSERLIAQADTDTVGRSTAAGGLTVCVAHGDHTVCTGGSAP